LLVASVLASVASAQARPAAVADVRDRLSRFLGTVTFVEETGGVHLQGTLRNLPAGPHGFHIANIAKCLSPSFLSAGAIFNPTGKKHGLRNAAGPQVGDLPSLVIAADGTATLDLVAAGATLSSGPTSLIGGDGTALVIHVGDDDQVTEPEGNAGERLACGVILPTDPVAASATAQSRGPTTASATATPSVIQMPPQGAAVVAVPQSAPVAQPVAQVAQQRPQVVPVAQETQPVRPGSNIGSILGSPPVIGGLGLVLLVAGYLLHRRVHAH
jgi:superoxide dismutase, Cu-Zn family